jgi:hypothetical protein
MTPKTIRRHQAAYRAVVALTPLRHRARFGESQVTLFGDQLATGERPLRLWFGVVPDLARVLVGYRSDLSCTMARAGLAIVGALPVSVGLLIGSTWVDEFGDVGAMFPAAATSLVLQGTFGVLWLTRSADGWRPTADRLFLAGEVTALVLATVVIALAAVTKSPANPESLRLLAGGAAAVHAILGLNAYRLTRRREARSVPD